LSEEDYLDVEIRKLEEFFYFHASENDMAAAIVEVVQGEGGFRVMPKRYLQALRRLCTDHKMLLILDEVQSGFGRTGKWAAYEHYGVTPDLSTWAKAMGSGMPIGCVIGRAEVMDAAVPGTIGGTYPGNPVCCAASLLRCVTWKPWTSMPAANMQAASSAGAWKGWRRNARQSVRCADWEP
jgi:4-aminobutyrate aminotransferase/(S)-3-amino-2-methylpropionate transaminase